MTAESLDEVVENVIGRSPADLAGYAASAALNELLPNWKQALDEGTNIKELTSDIDDLVLLLNNFKAFCTEKQVPAVLNGSLLNDVRRAYAEKCFADYDFKNLHVVDSSGWEVEGNQWYQSVYAEMVDADEGGSPITPLSFKVKFDEGSTTPRDCYAYDSSGSMI